jgi:hypothetical protein
MLFNPGDVATHILWQRDAMSYDGTYLIGKASAEEIIVEPDFSWHDSAVSRPIFSNPGRLWHRM